MRSFIFAIILLNLTLCSLSFTSALAADSAVLRGGKLEILAEGDNLFDSKKLLLNGKVLREDQVLGFSIKKIFSVADKDVVLVANVIGALMGCQVKYFFVTVTNQGTASLSPEFGTCNDTVKTSQKGLKIHVTIQNMNGKGKTNYLYYNGIITENGKPIKDEAENDGVIFVNSRGKVLVSGNPDKRVLKCVENYVEKEKTFSDGWNLRTMSECNKLKSP